MEIRNLKNELIYLLISITIFQFPITNFYHSPSSVRNDNAAMTRE